MLSYFAQIRSAHYDITIRTQNCIVETYKKHANKSVHNLKCYVIMFCVYLLLICKGKHVLKNGTWFSTWRKTPEIKHMETSQRARNRDETTTHSVLSLREEKMEGRLTGYTTEGRE